MNYTGFQTKENQKRNLKEVKRTDTHLNAEAMNDVMSCNTNAVMDPDSANQRQVVKEMSSIKDSISYKDV